MNRRAAAPDRCGGHPIRRYLQTFAEAADTFPGELPGVTAGTDSNGLPCHGVYCVKDAAR